MILYASGPRLLAALQRIRGKRRCQRVLADRPDPAAMLSNASALATTPYGNLGRAFCDCVNVPGGIAGCILVGLIYRDGYGWAGFWLEYQTAQSESESASL
jgi:hypothetical protein